MQLAPGGFSEENWLTGVLSARYDFMCRKSDFIERVKTAEKEISKGKCINFESMDDFLKCAEK